MKGFYIYRIFTLNHFITAIYVIYLRSLGCSFLTISLLHIIKDITVIVLEIPLSYASDKYSYKRILALSGIFMTFSILLMIYHPTTISLFLSFIFWGVAVSCDSGISDAYLYETLGNENYSKVQSNTIMWRQICGAFFKFIGAYTFSIASIIPFLLTLFNSIISTVSTFTFTKTNQKSLKKNLSFSNIKETLISKEYVSVVAHNIFLISFLTITFTYESIILVDHGLNVEYLGIITFIKLLISSVGVRFTQKLSSVKNISNFYIILYVLSTICVGLLGISNSLIVLIPSLLLISTISGIMFPFRTILLNKIIKTDRATLLSIQSQLQFFLRIVISLLISYIADNLSIKIALITLAFLTLLSILILTAVSRNNINKLNK